MEPYLTDRHEAWRAQVRAFAEATIAPVAAAYDASATFPWATVRAMADEGLFGLPWPSAWGGGDWDTFGYLLAVEELARVDASHAITVSAHTTLGTSPIVSFGTLSQRERFVPLLARGRVLAGFGLTEPGAGSDASASRTTAVRGDGGWILNGSKIFITHAGVGEVFVVTAVTDRSRGAHGITSFIVCKPNVETDEAARYGLGHAPELPFTPGVRAGKKEDKLGWRASDTRELLLENAFVPDDQVLGDIGEGFVNFLKTLDAGRIGLAALALGRQEVRPRFFVRAVAWGLLPFVVGLFLVIRGVENAGLSGALLSAAVERPAQAAAHLVGGETQPHPGPHETEAGGQAAAAAPWPRRVALAVAAALGSNLVNNIPMTLLGMGAVGQDRWAAYSLLLGVNLGPNLSIIGSLATMLALGLVRQRGVDVGGWSYLRVGLLAMPATLAAGLAGLWLAQRLWGGAP